jgi:hypothetical protein
VKVHDVEASLRQQAVQRPPFQSRRARLLRNQRRQSARATSQPVVQDCRMIVVRTRRRHPFGPQHVERIHAVHHFDVVPGLGQQVREAANRDAVSPEIERRIERGHQTESQGLPRPARGGGVWHLKHRADI